MTKHGFSEKELAKARAGVAGALRAEAERASIQSETDRLIQLFLVGSGRMSPDQASAVGQCLLAKVDLAAVRSRWAEWLTKGHRSLLVLRGPDNLSPLSDAELESMAEEISTRPLEPELDESDGPLLAELPEPGKVVATERMGDLDVHVWTLQNGAKVVFKPAPLGSGQLILRAVSPGGRAHIPPARYPNALLAEYVVRDSGVGEHDMASLFRLLEGTEASVQPWVDNDFEGIRGSSPPEELELMLQLAYLYMKSPRAAASALERYQSSLRAPLDPNRIFARDITEALHPGNTRLGKPDPNALDLDEMLAFFRDRFGNANDFTFVIVGNIAEAQLRQLVERYLASLPGSPRADRRAPLKDERRPGITRVRTAGRSSGDSAVQLEFYGAAKPNALARMEIEALTAFLEGALLEALRLRRGAVYSPAVSATWSADGYTLTIAFNCLPSDVSDLQAATWDVITKLGHARVSDAAVAQLKSVLRERHAKALGSNQFWADRLAEAYMFDTSPSDILALPELTEHLTRESLAEAARRYLDRNQYLDAVWSAN